MAESKARGTLSQSRFFLDQARVSEGFDRSAFGHFLGAAIVFGRSVTFHLQKEYSSRPSFEDWYRTKQAERTADPIFPFLRDKRNYILKEGSIPVEQTITISISDTVRISGHVEARVIRGKPWYQRRASTWIQDIRAEFIRTFRRFARFTQQSLRKIRAAPPTRVATSRRLHFEESPWNERAATEVIDDYLSKLERIADEAEEILLQ